MATKIEARPDAVPARSRSRLAGPSLVLGGVAFGVGGVMHPTGSGEGNKVHQLHEMLVDSSWYPSHAVLLAAMAFFAAGVFALRQRRDLTSGIERLLTFVFVIACVATAAMVVHLFAALGAGSLADGKESLVSWVQTVNETVAAVWGLALAVLAVVGGRAGTVGNRLTIPFGLAGGLAFALASATIPYTDTFDSLFKIGSLLSIWAILVGVTEIARHRHYALARTRIRYWRR